MDLKLRFKPLEGADVVFTAPDLETDGGLETAVILSLFCDRRAKEDDGVPGDAIERRGWWGDRVSEYPGDEIGSKLWLLKRENLTAKTIERAKQYAEDALAWLIKDGVASKINVAVERRGLYALVFGIDVYPPTGGDVAHYEAAWGDIDL